ncbi:hypothetical protein ACLB2K_029011 [Fragaria x ananassa]
MGVQMETRVRVAEAKQCMGRGMGTTKSRTVENVGRSSSICCDQSLAQSERALDDLVELVQESNNVGKTVLPIFYEEAFAYYDMKYKDEPGKVERWRAALRKLGNLAGWDSKHWTEGKLIQDVVDETRRILCSSFSKPPEKIIKASKVGKEHASMMKAFAKYEEAHTLVNAGKTHKGKASLRNKEKTFNQSKRKMDEIRLGVNYGGKWVGSVYVGGKTEEIVVSEDITYNELLDQLYHIVGLIPNENEIKISTIDESMSPAYPVEIINDDDLKQFIDQSPSSDMHWKHPLRKSSRRRMEVRILVNHDGEWVNSTCFVGKTKGIIISEDITYQELVDRVCAVVGVDPNEYKVPHLQTQIGSSSPDVPRMQQQQQQHTFLPTNNVAKFLRALSTTILSAAVASVPTVESFRLEHFEKIIVMVE